MHFSWTFLLMIMCSRFFTKRQHINAKETLALKKIIVKKQRNKVGKIILKYRRYLYRFACLIYHPRTLRIQNKVSPKQSYESLCLNNISYHIFNKKRKRLQELKKIIQHISLTYRYCFIINARKANHLKTFDQ